MTTDRDFDRIAMAWLADGPEELPDRVIDAAVDQIHLIRQRRATRASWRLPTMTTPTRAAAAALIGVLAFGGALLFLGGGPSPAPSPSPSPSPSASPAASASETLAPLSQTFVSPRHGYTVQYPAGWTATPASRNWATGTETIYGDPALDSIGNAEARLAVASQPIRDGDPEAWLVAYCRSGSTADSCGPTTKIGNLTGYVHEDGTPASGGTVATGGVVFDAVLTMGTRGYEFTLDGHVDRALFDALLRSVTFQPADAIDLPPLTGTFRSPTNGFSLKIASDWKPTTATTHWHGLGNPSDAMDGVDITGTDTSFGVASQPLGKQTFAEYLAAYHTDSIPNVPGGCDGGDPSTWPEVQIGDKIGLLQRLCNADDAFVEAGGRVYILELGHATFTVSQHFSVRSWEELLKSVTLDPGAAH